MFFTYPMEFFVARQSLHAVLTRFSRPADLEGHAQPPRPTVDLDVQTVSSARHWAYTGGLFSVSLLLGLVLEQDHLHLVLDINGGVCASFLGFILPGGISMALAHADNPHPDGSGQNTTPAVRWARFFRSHPKQVTLVLVGSLAFVSSLYFALSSIGKPKHSSADTCPVTGAEN